MVAEHETDKGNEEETTPDRPRVWQVPDASIEQAMLDTIGCKVICGIQTILVVKGVVILMKILSGRDSTCDSSVSS